MKMVAAAKLKRAQDKVIQLRPFSQKLSLVLSNVSSSGSINNEFFTERDVKNILVIVIGSDKGLCGSFNSNIFKKFDLLAKDDAYNSKILTVLPIGKKVNDFFKKTKYKTIHDYWDVLKEFNYEKASEITDNIMNMFKSGEIDKVDIIFNEFKNVAVQNTIAEFFLPVIKSPENNNSTYNYIFEPEKNKIISDLIPQTLKTQFFKSVLESSASEQGSRMTAMSQATDNAGELLKELKLTYNRSRQAAITKEILEIVGGSEALNN